MIPKTTGRITEMVNSKGFEDYVDWYQEGFEAAREEASRVSDEIPYAGAAAYLAWWLAKRGEAPREEVEYHAREGEYWATWFDFYGEEFDPECGPGASGIADCAGTLEHETDALLRLAKRDRGDATVEVLARRLGRSWLYEECPWAPPASPFDGAGE